MDSNLQPAEKRPTHRQIMLAVIITAVTAVVAALAHTAVLLFSYDSRSESTFITDIRR